MNKKYIILMICVVFILIIVLLFILNNQDSRKDSYAPLNADVNNYIEETSNDIIDEELKDNIYKQILNNSNN